MMLRVIDDEAAIHQCNEKLSDAFRRGGTGCDEIPVSHRGGPNAVKGICLKELQLWLRTKTHPGSRYWNAFGTTGPRSRKGVVIDCEINFPVGGIDRRIGGVFAQNEPGRIFILHRGNIAGGSKRFWDGFTRERCTVLDGDRQTTMAWIGELGSEELPRQIRAFVDTVIGIKAGQRGHAEPPGDNE